MYKIRIILDTKEDVIRTLLVDDQISLETLHYTIAKSFGFNGQEMASFYLTDDDWTQGEEIPLFNMSDDGMGLAMNTAILNEVLPNEGDKLIYVYDFLALWTFYVEILETSPNHEADLPKTILAIGEIPEEAPEKEFSSDRFEDMDLDDDSFSEDFENLDDIDFDSY